MSLLVGEIFRRNAAMFPRRIAAAMGDRHLDYAELNARANALAHVLSARGVGPGARVVCWSDTRLEVVPLFAALAKLGAVFAPLNARIGVEEGEKVAAVVRPTLIVSDAERAQGSRRLGAALGASTLLLDGGGPDESLAALGSDAPRDEVAATGLTEEAPHVVFFTSGSTGRPKGVVLSHRVNFLRSYRGLAADEPEHLVCMFPLFHMAAFTLALGAWQTAGSVSFVAVPDAEGLLSEVERRRANRLYCIPAVWRRIFDSDAGRFDLSSLRVVDTGTSATPLELLRELKARFPGTQTRVFYGSTEAGPGTILCDSDVLGKPGSVGTPLPGVELRLTADGEICLRSDLLMNGYFDDAEATASAIVDGWYHTGDLGALDDEGYLWVTGRLREVLRTGGETVVPSEVESVIAEHPAVAEVAVVGLPDPDWGETICAVVVVQPGARVTLEEIGQRCDGRLARFKRPRRLEIVEALPRTAATGQVQRRLLVERIVSGAASRSE